MSDAQVALLQRRVLAWDYWQLYQSYGQHGHGSETLRRLPSTFTSAEVRLCESNALLKLARHSETCS